MTFKDYHTRLKVLEEERLDVTRRIEELMDQYEKSFNEKCVKYES